MVGLVSPRKRCTYSAKNARVSVQSHGADLGDKGKRPNWRRFYYSPIENGKVVVAPVNAHFDDRTTTGVANVVMVSSRNNANGMPPYTLNPNLEHPTVGGEGSARVLLELRRAVRHRGSWRRANWAATLRPTSRRHFSKANDPGRTLRRVF